ncbi:MAG: hypothetical protein HRU15_00505 [Planctomycetes bacterium]|nr:hypothetical protein [Planctomycetota bacterium]
MSIGSKLLLVILWASLSSCGDLDPSTIFNDGSYVPTIGDGIVRFYRDPQVISPAQPGIIYTDDDVRIGVIIIYRPGVSTIVPTDMDFDIRPTVDPSLPTVTGSEPLVYEPINALYPAFVSIAPQWWASFNPMFGVTPQTPLFDTPTYQVGDFYYAVVVRSLGVLPAGTHDYTIEIDQYDAAGPTDRNGTVKTRTISFTVIDPSAPITVN